MSNWRKEWRYSALYDDIGDRIDEWVAKAAPYGVEAKYWEPVIKAIEKVLEQVESEAIAAEREECAKIATTIEVDTYDIDTAVDNTREAIAAAIRARGQT